MTLSNSPEPANEDLWDKEELLIHVRSAFWESRQGPLVVRGDVLGFLSLDFDLAELSDDELQSVIFCPDKGEKINIPIDEALDLMNADDSSRVAELVEKRFEGYEVDPKDSNVVRQPGIPWWFRKSQANSLQEFGKCSGCEKSWASQFKFMRCTCGGPVYLT